MDNQLLNGYLSTIISKGGSEETVYGYKLDITMFMRYIKRMKNKLNNIINDINISDIDNEFLNQVNDIDIDNFMNYLVEIGNGDSARARKVSVCKNFYNYLLDRKLVTNNPFLNKRVKIAQKEAVYLNLNEAKNLVNSINGIYKIRDFAIITLFLQCGLRVSELVNINTDDIKDNFLIVNGKGNKQRVIPLNKSCIDAINKYIKIRKEVKNKALFLSERNNRISKRTVQSLVKKYLEEANLDTEKYHTHTLRHTATSLMFQYGKVDIRTLQKILGHSNLNTTQRYTHIGNEEIINAIKNNPLNI